MEAVPRYLQHQHACSTVISITAAASSRSFWASRRHRQRDPLISLAEGATVLHPVQSLPERVTLESPALEVMTTSSR
jgi:hypothetical protein